MSVELRHMRAFLAVADAMSFRRGAARLNVAQPALSRTIRQLEALTGLQLFERTTRTVRLTAAGQSLLGSAQRLVLELDQAVRTAQRIERGTQGELFVGYNDFAINGPLPAILRLFRSRFPGVRVSLQSGTSPEMVAMLAGGRLDIAFLMEVPASHSLEQVPIRHETVVCVLPTGHRLARRRTVALGDLAGEPFVMGQWSTWEVYVRVIDELCRAAGFRPNIVQEAEHSDGIIGLVAAGIGVTLHVDSDWLRYRNGIIVRSLREPAPPIQSIACWPADAMARAPSLGHFVTAIRDALATAG